MVKGYLLQRKRAFFYNPKERLLQSKRASFELRIVYYFTILPILPHSATLRYCS